ncbi:hypothetical protein BH10BAC4_BH10BAC4_01830 [soil metagenome]
MGTADFSIKKLINSLLIVLFFTATSQAQNLSAGARVMPMAESLLNGLPISRPASNVIGDIYLNSKPNHSTITLYENNQVMEGYLVRYNIYHNELDVTTQNGERALESSRIKSFVLRDLQTNTFVNARDYNLDGVPFLGFLELLVDGPTPLFKFTYLIIKNPDYQPALNTGSRDTRILKDDKFFYANGKELYETKSKKKITRVVW